MLTWEFYSEFKCSILKWSISWTKYHCIPFHKIILTFYGFQKFQKFSGSGPAFGPKTVRNFENFETDLGDPEMPSGGSSWILLKSLIILRFAGDAIILNFLFGLSFQNYRRLARALRRLLFQPTRKIVKTYTLKNILNIFHPMGVSNRQMITR